jgi:hypothetical protein
MAAVPRVFVLPVLVPVAAVRKLVIAVLIIAVLVILVRVDSVAGSGQDALSIGSA